MARTVYAGAQAPEALRLSVANATSDPDPLNLSTVTAAELVVERPNGHRETWAATIESQSATALELEHEFAATDVEHPGDYRIAARLTVPSGVRRTTPTVLRVLRP